MKDHKIRMRRGLENRALSKDINERLELIDRDMDLKLETLAFIFSGTRGSEEFHQLYVLPLLDAGLPLEQSLSALVEGLLLPN
jgi:hypothetical protein